MLEMMPGNVGELPRSPPVLRISHIYISTSQSLRLHSAGSRALHAYSTLAHSI